MRLFILSPLLFSVLTSAFPKKHLDFSLVGYAKDNPEGPTTGGHGGPSITVTSPSALASAAAAPSPLTIYLKGTFTLPTRLFISSNKSLLGHGPGATITGAGLTANSSTNIIIRNLYIHSILANDAITLTNSTRIWIDHNTFSSSLLHGPDHYEIGRAHV